MVILILRANFFPLHAAPRRAHGTRPSCRHRVKNVSLFLLSQTRHTIVRSSSERSIRAPRAQYVLEAKINNSEKHVRTLTSRALSLISLGNNLFATCARARGSGGGYCVLYLNILIMPQRCTARFLVEYYLARYYANAVAQIERHALAVSRPRASLAIQPGDGVGSWRGIRRLDTPEVFPHANLTHTRAPPRYAASRR